MVGLTMNQLMLNLIHKGSNMDVQTSRENVKLRLAITSTPRVEVSDPLSQPTPTFYFISSINNFRRVQLRIYVLTIMV